MKNNEKPSLYDKLSDGNQPEITPSPWWRELILRLVRHGRRFLYPAKPSPELGIGSVANGHGATFRVWAPNARHVLVSGTFNRWSQERHPLASEKNGYWSTLIREARPGDEYKYVIHNGSGRHLRPDPYARDIVPQNNNSVISETAAESDPPAEAPGWMPKWNELVIYELHVGTFNPENGQVPGQFRDVTRRLPYLKHLGINAIEIMPIAEFSGDYSWGYNPAFPFAVTRTYGGREAFREFVEAAHQHGIAVIVDVVYNHFGPENLSLWQFDGWHEDGKGGIYFYNDWRSTTPWADTRPDYGRHEVRQYIRDNALMWLEEYQVDGLRWDATAWIRSVYGHDHDPDSDIAEGWGLMRWVNDEINMRRPWAISIAEDLRGSPWITKSTSASGAGFDAQWDERFVHPIREAIIAAEDAQRDMHAVADAILANYHGDVFDRIIYTESHDEVANGKARVPEDIAPGDAASSFSRQRSALGAALVFTAPGIPMIFQGQEFLEDGWFEDTRPLDWQKAEENTGLIHFYRDLIHLRRNSDSISRGLTGQKTQILFLDNEQKLIALHRWEQGGPGDDVVIIANFANANRNHIPIPFPRPGIWHLRLNSGQANYGLALMPDQPSTVQIDEGPAQIKIPPYGVLIYSQDPT